MRSLSLLPFLPIVIALSLLSSFAFALEENNDDNNNILRPTAAIITRNGGAITTLLATLSPPIKKSGYHDVELSWCKQSDWFECLESANETSKCTCGAPILPVEESIRFQQTKQKQQEHEGEQEQQEVCSVVSQHWETN
jgi:hypothetical protein